MHFLRSLRQIVEDSLYKEVLIGLDFSRSSSDGKQLLSGSYTGLIGLTVLDLLSAQRNTNRVFFDSTQSKLRTVCSQSCKDTP